MRVVLDEDIPSSLTPAFGASGHTVSPVEELGLKGQRNSVLLAAMSETADVFVTGNTNLGHQQNLPKFDLAIILLRPIRLDGPLEVVPLDLGEGTTSGRAPGPPLPPLVAADFTGGRDPAGVNLRR